MVGCCYGCEENSLIGLFICSGGTRAKRWWSGPKYVIVSMVWVVKIFSHRKLSIRQKSMSFGCMLPLSKNIQKISRSYESNLGKSLTYKWKDVRFFCCLPWIRSQCSDIDRFSARMCFLFFPKAIYFIDIYVICSIKWKCVQFCRCSSYCTNSTVVCKVN